jgi:hypothetical protein
MLNFALGRDLAITGTWCQPTNINKATWKSPDNKKCNSIHHKLVDRRHCMNESDVECMRSAEIQSDGSLVRAKM